MSSTRVKPRLAYRLNARMTNLSLSPGNERVNGTTRDWTTTHLRARLE
ncbi:MAG: hypothetical protein IPM54_05780 [Polyangiaceae bacterium]|nr:hypothetical protein [Polyangiaceae bacterium]